jgi:hypothetical protein
MRDPFIEVAITGVSRILEILIGQCGFHQIDGMTAPCHRRA